MKAYITNFMGCSYSEIEAAPIALIIGTNFQGKSSTLNAIVAALTGETLPAGLKKDSAGLCVKLGTTGGAVRLEHGDNTAEINWPKAELHTTGVTPPSASRIAAGLMSILSMDEKKRVEFLRSLLNCFPSKGDLVKALSENGVSEKHIDALWELIDRDGWDATLLRTTDKNKELKGQWRAVSGEQYGSKKAASWTPQGWSDNLHGASLDELNVELAAAKAYLEKLIVNQAISADERLRLENIAQTLLSAETAFLAAKKELEISSATLSAIDIKIEKLPPLPAQGMLCPNCNTPLIIKDSHLEKIAAMPLDEVRSVEAQLNRYRKDRENTSSEVIVNQERVKILDSDVQKAQDASGKLNNLPEEIPSEDISAARERVQTAEKSITAFSKYNESQQLHTKIVKNQAIIEALDENGLRRRSLEKGLLQFNELLTEISTSCGWSKVSVDKDLSAYMDNRPYSILSSSERFRVNLTLQFAVAELDGSQAVVIDAAELLDNKGRSGLLRYLNAKNQISFIAMTASAPDKVPRLSDMGVGRVYWMENGNSREVF